MSRQGLCLGAVARWPLSGHKSLLSPPASSTPGPRSANGPSRLSGAQDRPTWPSAAPPAAPPPPASARPASGLGCRAPGSRCAPGAREAGGQCLPCRVLAPEQ